jgi:hypothetical protein
MDTITGEVTLKLSITDALALHEVLTELINTRQAALHTVASISLHRDEFETVKVAQRVLENAINLLQEEV